MLFNEYTGLGTQNDSLTNLKVFSNHFTRNKTILDNCFQSLWQCRKICSLYPQLMIKQWGDLSFIKKVKFLENIKKDIEKLRYLYCKAQITANLYGGSVIIRLIEDGLDFDQPVNVNNIKSIDYSRVHDRWEVYPQFTNIDDVENPELYYYYSGSEIKRIHKDRVIRFRGNYLPTWLLYQNNGWDDSLLTSFLIPLLRYITGEEYTSEALKDFEVTLYQIEGLSEMNQENVRNLLKDKLMTIQEAKSVLRGVVADTSDKIELLSRKFNGVVEILLNLREEMIGASGLTKPQLYQEHPSGLNATGKSELLTEASNLLALQNEKWSLNLNQDIEYLIYLYNKKLIPFTWEWKSIYEQTPTETLQDKLVITQIDDMNIRNQIYSPEEARNSHFSSSEFVENITLDNTKYSPSKTPIKEEKESKENKESKEMNVDEVKKFKVEGKLLPESFYDDDLEDLIAVEYE